MDDDDAIWKLLAARPRTRAPDADDLAGRRLRRESMVKILTAAIGVVTATRELLDVTEAALLEHRDRLALGAETRGEDDCSLHERGHKRSRIDLSY
jgi:hypothetical protein